MKKLIAISVMIALIAGAAFADTSVGGSVESRVNLYEGEFGDHGEAYDGGYPKPTTSGLFGAAWVGLSGSSDDGTMGGMLRIRMTDIADGSLRFHRVFVWWKPLPEVRFFLGQDADGMFETGQLTSWAFHQGSENYLTVHDWDFWRKIFPGNWDTFGAALSFYLMPGLDLNLVIPIGNPSGWPRHRDQDVKRKSELETIYPGSLQLTAGYNIEGVGKVAFAWIGSGTNYFDDDNTKFGKIALSFYSGSLVDGLSFQLGFSTDLEKEVTNPITAGAAVHFGAGDLGVKFRIGTDIPLEDTQKMFLTTNIMPTYNTSIGKICLDIGFSMQKTNSEADMETGWWVNPYLKKGLNGGYFQIGIMVLNNIDGGQGGNHNVKVNDQPRVYFPLLLGFNL